MFPCIQPGDILHIESRTIDQITIGNIIVFRRGSYLFGHRAIAKGTENGKPHIVTRPDRTQKSDDGSTYSEDVLGVVTAIERGSARMPLDQQPLHGVTALRASIWEWWNWEARVGWIERLRSVQQRTWYSRLASAWLHLSRPRLSYLVRVPLVANQSLDLYRELLLDTFDISQASCQGKPVMRWLLGLCINDTRPAVASGTISWHPEGCPHGGGWHIHEMQTRLRYRSAGLEVALIAQVEAILARGGMTLQRTNL